MNNLNNTMMNNSTVTITRIPTELSDFINNNNFNHSVESFGINGDYDVYTNDWNISIIPNTVEEDLSYEVHLNYHNDDWSGDCEIHGTLEEVLNYLSQVV